MGSRAFAVAAMNMSKRWRSPLPPPLRGRVREGGDIALDLAAPAPFATPLSNSPPQGGRGRIPPVANHEASRPSFQESRGWRGFLAGTFIASAALAAAGATALAVFALSLPPLDISAARERSVVVLDRDGSEFRIIKGAYQAVVGPADAPADARRLVDELAQHGNRVIAVAMGPSDSLHLQGLIAISDPPRKDSAQFIRMLEEMGIRTVMVTGDSPVTAAAIARQVGIVGAVCPAERISEALSTAEFGVFARVVPEEKYQLVKALQSQGHVVGMCGDGVNDAPALRQAQIGIAVTSATDVAKAAAGMVLTEPGLSGIVFAIREGRIAFRRLLTFTLNMLVKKIEIVLFLAMGLVLTGHAVLTPTLMVLMIMTNDFLAMSLMTDRASPAPSPSRWQMREITTAAIVLSLCKLSFSTVMLVFGKFRLGLGPEALRTLAFLTLVFGNQAVMYVVRESGRMWRSKPSSWVLASSVSDMGLVSALALSGILMTPLPWRAVVLILLAAAAFALLLDQVKLQVMSLRADWIPPAV